MTSDPITPEMAALKAKLKTTWESGDYGVFAQYLVPGAIEFFDRLKIEPGVKLLDVGCGAGQIAIPAAKRGIRVSAVDLAQNLVDQARLKASQEGLDIEIQQGDAESLPFPDETFDVVLSLIGAMFAPRPNAVAAELLRVCRPGGKIIMANWTPEGHVGQMFKVIGKHIPSPAIFPSPLLWGDESKLRERFNGGVTEFQITRNLYPFNYPFSPEEVVEFFATYYGPTNRAFLGLEPDGKAQLKNDLVELWTANNRSSNGSTEVKGEYLQMVAVRA